MAPNQKQNLATLQRVPKDDLLLDSPKQFLPLTALDLDNADLNDSPKTVISNIASDEYWSWENKASAFQDFFSAAFLEANLLKESQRLAARDDVTIIRAHRQEDAYWDVQASLVRSEANEAVSQRTGYWDWPQDDITAVQIALIMKEELARGLLSAPRMEERLLEDARIKRHYLDQTKAENDTYWNWESPTTVYAAPGTINESYWEWQQEDQSCTAAALKIANILEYEAKRGLFSIDHLIETLTSTVFSCEQQVFAPHQVESDAYWDCSAQEECYWDWDTSIPVLVSPAQEYWDW